MKTSIFYYCAVFVVVLSSVLLGLDWQSAPMSPMPEIKVVALAPPPVAPVKAAVPSVPAPNAAAPANPVTARPAVTVPVPPLAVAPAPVAQTPPRPLCDVAACAAAYRSFRESDCTYNPSFGERRLCTKGVPPSEAAAPPAAPDAPPPIVTAEPGASPDTPPPDIKCNVSACAAAYRSFRESDCTFNPSVGPRQLCKK